MRQSHADIADAPGWTGPAEVPQIGQAVLRAATLADLPSVLALNRATWARWGLSGDETDPLAYDIALETEDRAERLLRRAVAGAEPAPGDPVPLLLLCEERGRLLGYALGWCSPPPVATRHGQGLQDRFADITDLALLPEAAARGLGRRLLDAVLTAMRRTGCTTVRLRLSPAQTATGDLIRAHGFGVASIEHSLRLAPRLPVRADTRGEGAIRLGRGLRRALPLVAVAGGLALLVGLLRAG